MLSEGVLPAGAHSSSPPAQAVPLHLLAADDVGKHPEKRSPFFANTGDVY